MADSFVPSDDEVISRQSPTIPVCRFSVQVAPESVDVQMLPPETTAASFVPSDDEAIEDQYMGLVNWEFSVQAAHVMHMAMIKRNLRIMEIRFPQDLGC